ncbi:MAG: PA14 domain-containing protein, partial [Saprospiraceae bacterium]
TAMDSSIVRVDIANDFGLISSESALLRVTSNHRPLPNILLPLEGATYEAGNTLHFSGTGLDEEDGTLNSDAFEWKIDFHHGAHSHPSMPWTDSIHSGQWHIPSIGETASDVYYRIYLRVRDSYGLVKTVSRDIFPQLGSLEVRTSPPGLIMHVDGSPVETPHIVEGVRGISRYISPPFTQIKGDSIYFFNQWRDGSKIRIREVTTGSQNQLFECQFDGFRKGYGVGLTASYYENIEFSGIPMVIEIDSMIDHQWYLQSPHPAIAKDYFGIKWEGYIQAYKSALYKFIAFVDDGAHLEIEGEQVFHVRGPGLNYVTGSKYLEAGRLYPIVMKMYDLEWTSQIKFRWSSDDFVEEIVPSSQLYPADFYTSNLSSTILSVQSVTDDELQIFSKGLKNITMDFVINSLSGYSYQYNDYFVPVEESVITLDIRHLIPGAYFMTGIDPLTNEKAVLKFVKVK